MADEISFLEATKARRSLYALSKESPISNDRIISIVEHALRWAPTPFNARSCRCVILFGSEHDRLWDLGTAGIQQRMPMAVDILGPKVQGFKAGYGTVLFFEDVNSVRELSPRFAKLSEDNPEWYEQSSGMHQYVALPASGNFGSPITAALVRAGLDVTIITRTNSTTQHPSGVPTIRTGHTVGELTRALAGQDAAVCVVGPGAIHLQVTIIDAAEAAGVQRFIIDDFGWGPDIRSLPEFGTIHAQRRAGWDHAKVLADANHGFTYTGVTIGNCIDWSLKKFPLMGLDVAQRSATIYDSGTERFTATTSDGIGQAVLGVLQHPDETANRFVKVRSIKTCQNELLEGFQSATGQKWEAHRSTTKALMESGRSKFQAGGGGWVLELVVAQLFDEGEARCVVASSREESDADLLGVVEETVQDVVAKVLKSV
ncbi:hypothetical protein MBLNU459_g3845t1 [Dothideomycetes sp. NU459]